MGIIYSWGDGKAGGVMKSWGVDTPAIGTSISASHVEMIPDPPITLNPNYAICSTFSTEMYQYIVDNGNAAWETISKKLF